MFDKFKARIAKLEEDHDNLRKLHQHVDSNKIAYAAGASGLGCLILGGMAGLALGHEVAVSPTAKNMMLLGYKSPQSIIQETVVNVAAKGSRGHIIVDGAGNVVGRSLREAAANEHVPYTTMRNVCKGLRATAGNGKTYTDLGENLSEQIKVGLA
jgi:hypothetical protein